eukprot:535583_1
MIDISNTNSNITESESLGKRVKYKCCRIGFDGSWHNRIYGRNSLNGCATFLDQNLKKVIHFDTRSKKYNYPHNRASGDMEAEMLIYGIAYLQSKHIHPWDISVDGDAKIPKLMNLINNNSLKLMLGLPQIDLSADIAHTKKNLAKNVYKFKHMYDWKDAKQKGYNVCGFTFDYCRLL